MPYPPEGYKITTDVPVMAPHDFSEDLGGYVDIWPLNITANVPVVNGVASREPHGVGAGIGLRFPKIFLKSLENGWKDLERFRATWSCGQESMIGARCAMRCRRRRARR